MESAWNRHGRSRAPRREGPSRRRQGATRRQGGEPSTRPGEGEGGRRHPAPGRLRPGPGRGQPPADDPLDVSALDVSTPAVDAPPWAHRRERARRQRTRGSAGTSACQRSISHPLCRLNSASTARPCQKPVTRAVAGPPSTIVHIAPDGTARNGSLPSASARSSAPHARSGAGWPPRAGRQRSSYVPSYAGSPLSRTVNLSTSPVPATVPGPPLGAAPAGPAPASTPVAASKAAETSPVAARRAGEHDDSSRTTDGDEERGDDGDDSGEGAGDGCGDECDDECDEGADRSVRRGTGTPMCSGANGARAAPLPAPTPHPRPRCAPFTPLR